MGTVCVCVCVCDEQREGDQGTRKGCLALVISAEVSFACTGGEETCNVFVLNIDKSRKAFKDQLELHLRDAGFWVLSVTHGHSPSGIFHALLCFLVAFLPFFVLQGYLLEHNVCQTWS